MVRQRNKKVEVGQFVEICQIAHGQKVWLPFMVTHVHEDSMISGVAFSGVPAPVGWGNRGAQPFQGVQQGHDNREWQPRGMGMPETPDPDPNLWNPNRKTWTTGKTKAARMRSSAMSQPNDRQSVDVYGGSPLQISRLLQLDAARSRLESTEPDKAPDETEQCGR